MEKKKFFIKSMGCKSNQFEGSIIIENMIKNGFVQTLTPSEADYFILNSCSVTQKSDNESLYILRNAKHLYPQIKTVITGCVAQIEKEKLLEMDYIDFVFGNNDKFDMAQDLLSCKSEVTDIMNVDTFNYQILNDVSKTRFSLKIQDGCNNRCAYCIIPFARGKSRSADSNFIINRINTASENGFKEVVLTGIHIGQWGADIDKSFIDLIRDIEEKTTIPRYRLGSLNPREINSDLLNLLEQSDKFCPHFHLSLQSACNSTLKRMRRYYTVEEYLDQINDINSRFKNPFLGADIIAGFVGETEEEFETTVDNLKKSGLTKIHTFPYSIRKGTQAESMDNHLSQELKQKRADIIKKISNDKYKEFISKNLGSVQEILIEKRPDKKTGELKGVTRNYLKVRFEPKSDSQQYLNTLITAPLSEYKNDSFYAKLNI